jgi:hypothetical protein
MAFWLVQGLLGCGTVEPDSLGECTTQEGAAPVPRQLRLLTRREYDRTVADLLPQLVGRGDCATDADCDLEVDSCVGGVCQPDPCELVTFVFPWGGEGSVSVAGSFNGWSADAWPMTAAPERGVWYRKEAIADGEHPYKFVLDGAVWVPDPANPVTAEDGYGGVNSLLVQSCLSGGESAPAEAEWAPSAGFPVESPPAGFPFDNAAQTGLVTSVHAQLYGEAAHELALAAASDLPGLLGCAPDEACVRSWVERFGRRAFRRALTPEEGERYAALALGLDVSVALQAMLQSPHFLYRSEVGAPAGGLYQLDGPEIATAMSYFLWGTLPDEELLAAGESGELADGEARAGQARRMLQDPRARETVQAFAVQWLDVAHVPTETRSDPAFDRQLGESMVEETAQLVGSTVFDGSGRFEELLLSETTRVDSALASLYGLPPPDGPGWHEVTLPPERRGLLGHASVLTATAHSDQSSPIRRGLFVQERLLCTTFPTPPAEVGPVPTVSPDATTRERFEQHTADPFCASCHEAIDPIGFGLEGFDELGRHRTEENGLPIDTRGNFPVARRGLYEVSVSFDGGVGLAQALSGMPEASSCFATQLWRFSAGRLETEAQRCELEALHRGFEAAGGDIRELLVQIVSRQDFVTRGEP